MIKKWETIKKITEPGLVLIIRTDNTSIVEKAVEASILGGVKAIELSYTVNKATEIIERLARVYKSEASIGAGTVLDSETARIAILSGAEYIISPSYNKDTAVLCNRYQIPYIPGCMTIDGIVEAMETGCDIIKLFPAEVLGIGAVRAIKAPLPQANLMPTGGITAENVADWIKAGAIAVGIGGNVVKLAENNDFALITKTVQKYVENIKLAREQLPVVR